ncbi:MAG: hypothetical protein GWN84_04250 [Gammaproteobacteria bacterium]|nr:hypothetical protein [Gammaproteobacteria bacterium]NIR82208.1 hypothetical protein [Gammaproteobacteria bacterium]NIR90807.1 hypothetical protein [Gammaproteobacteria bacterium]NIU03358.1 hypothetical protein [Gammaproteobacteria bacterium]NIV50854.1 hypothetical protein [Gammaproteobacteria bacterium]
MSAEPSRQASRNRAALVAVVALCVLPLAVAWVLTLLPPDWRPFGTAHHGRLVEPPETISAAGLSSLEDGRVAPDYFMGKWTLVVVPPLPCDDGCRELLYRTRQARRALGKDRDRVQRLWVLPADATLENQAELLARHPGLRLARAESSWLRSLPGRDTDRGRPDGIYLVDPRARLMMAYAQDASAEGMLEDLRRLLKASRIG